MRVSYLDCLVCMALSVTALTVYLHFRLQEMPSGNTSISPSNYISRYNKSVSTIRYKVTGNKTYSIQILYGNTTTPEMLQVAEKILKYYNEHVTNSQSGKERIMPFTLMLREALEEKSLSNLTPQDLWDFVKSWPVVDLVRLGAIRNKMENSAITTASEWASGTQMKLQLKLSSGITVMFKPQLYPKEVVLNGMPYSGKDRHFAEVAAFYLNLLLRYDRAPVTLSKQLLLPELYFTADEDLNKTFHWNSTLQSFCFYGRCRACSAKNLVCGDANNNINGSLSAYVYRNFTSVYNPWRRNYTSKGNTEWEKDAKFCVTGSKDYSILNDVETVLDIVAMAVFDFIIGNGDRHALDILEEMVYPPAHTRRILLLDNANSFGNPFEDYIDILAPLFQCCIMRRNLYNLLKTYEGALGSNLKYLMEGDLMAPLLTDEHLLAVDRRLIMVLASVEYCLDKDLSGLK